MSYNRNLQPPEVEKVSLEDALTKVMGPGHSPRAFEVCREIRDAMIHKCSNISDNADRVLMDSAARQSESGESTPDQEKSPVRMQNIVDIEAVMLAVGAEGRGDAREAAVFLPWRLLFEEKFGAAALQGLGGI